MAEQKIHYLGLENVERRIKELRKLRAESAAAFHEVSNQGDFKENSGRDIEKDNLQRIVKELDTLLPALGYTPVKANPNVRGIEEGCVIRLRVYSVTPTPANSNISLPGPDGKEPTPIFDGVLLFGGAVKGQSILTDRALSATSPLGKAILGKQPGFFTAPVPGGHANFVVEKIMKDSVTGGEVTLDTVFRSDVYVG